MDKLSIDQYIKVLKSKSVLWFLVCSVLFVLVGVKVIPLFWIIFPIFFLLGGIAFAIDVVNLKKLLKDSIIEKELKENIIHYSDGYIVTKSYLIDHRINIEIMSYLDIILLYQSHAHVSGYNRYLHLVFRSGKECAYLIETSNFQANLPENQKYQDFTDVILKKNPNVLVGKTDENIKILREKYHITKKLKK